MTRRKRKRRSIYIFIFAPLILAYLVYSLISYFHIKNSTNEKKSQKSGNIIIKQSDPVK